MDNTTKITGLIIAIYGDAGNTALATKANNPIIKIPTVYFRVLLCLGAILTLWQSLLE